MAAKKSRKIILIDHEDLQPKRAKPSGPSVSQAPSDFAERGPKAAADQDDLGRSSQAASTAAPPDISTLSQEPSSGVPSSRTTQPLVAGAVRPVGGQPGLQRPLARPQFAPPGAQPRPPFGNLPHPGWLPSQANQRVVQNAPQVNSPAGGAFQSGEGSSRSNNRESAPRPQLKPPLQGLGSQRPGKEAGPSYPGVRQEFVQKPHVWQHPGKRASAAPKASPMLERLQKEATCQKLWDPPEEGELKPVPEDFSSVDAYIAAFEPFVFAECRAELRQEWQEVCDGSKNHYEVIVTGVETYETGGHDVRLTLRNPTIRLGMKKDASNLQFREGAVAVLTPAKPDLIDRRRGMQRSDQEKEEPESNQLRVAGVVTKYVQGELRGDADWVVVRVYADKGRTGNSKDAGTGTGPDAVLDLLKKESATWWFTPLSNLVTNQREYEGLHSIRHFQGLMKAAILKPKQELFPKYTEQEAPPLAGWLTAAFSEHLQRSFNPPQLASIKWSAAHVAASARGKSSQAASGGEEVWPFTLIQGPPGTGKTHTVWGILNVVHLVQYQRYFASLLQKLAPSAVASEEDPSEKPKSRPPSPSDGSLDSILSSMDASLKRILPQLSPKPRLLVCAPSNAATDELLARVLDRGFIDGELRSYKPNVARVGLDFGSPAAQAVSVERRANQLLSMKAEDVHKWVQQLQRDEQALRYRLSIVQKELAARAASSRGGAIGVDPEQLANMDKERDAKLQELAALREQHDKLLVELERLLIVGEKYRPGGGYQRTEGQLRRQLETSFAREAEIVFTTLSSSGREIFERLGHGFDTVVIDEAAQASEMAILPPLRLGCNRCILVGDPQQLPATVISQEAQTMLFSRSLFERFQLAGCPALMLTQQYRMHPVIREFPSRFFYEGRLTDDESVMGRPEEPYHRDHLLRPYIFFDVSKGQERQGGRSMSLQNKLEADFAVLLYSHFRASLPPGALPRLSVGAITPYKQQSAALKRAFDPIVADISKEGASITINTVDAYQGQERDIVILSCVRASPKGGVGFVADVRRMNVALTRARRALWILGNASSLSRNPDWEALIRDAKERGFYVDASNPEALFPPHIFDQIRALQVSEQIGPPGQGPSEPPGMSALPPGRKRQKALSPKGKGAPLTVQAGGELADVSGRGLEGVPGQSGRVESERGASVIGRTEAQMRGLQAHVNGTMGMPTSLGDGAPPGAEARRSLPSRDPRRAALGRSVPKSSNPGLPNLPPSTAPPKANLHAEIASLALRFRPPSPTPGGDPKDGPATVEASRDGQRADASGREPTPALEGAGQRSSMEAARMALTALGVDLRQLDSVRWDAVEKGLHAHTVRLRGTGAAAAQPSVDRFRGASGGVPRQDSVVASRSGTPHQAEKDNPGQSRPQFGGFGPQVALKHSKPSGAVAQPPAPPCFRLAQPGAYGGQPFAPGFPNGQLPRSASGAGGPPGFPASHLAGDFILQTGDARLGGQVVDTGAGPPPNGPTLPRLGRGAMGTQLGGGGFPAPADLPGLREPSANGGPPPAAQLARLDQQQGKAGLGRAKPSKKQKKGWKQHVDRDQGGGVGPLEAPRMRGRPQAASDPSAHLWNTGDLIGTSGGGGKAEARVTSQEERPGKASTKSGTAAGAFPLNASAAKRQWAFDLNSVPEDGDVDVDRGPPGFASEQEPG